LERKLERIITKNMNKEKYIIDKYKLDVKNQTAPYEIKISRWQSFPKLLAELGVKNMAEIGVEKGLYSDCLLKKIPDLKLYCIDPWKIYIDYRQGMESATEKYYKHASELLKDRATLIRKYSLDAVKDFENESLDMVFIDANHDFQNCTNDIVEWEKKVKKGGIIAGHDYCNEVCKNERIDVKGVVDGWASSQGIKTWFLITGDRRQVWFYIKK